MFLPFIAFAANAIEPPTNTGVTIELHINYNDPTKGTSPIKRLPAHIPHFYISDRTIFSPANIDTYYVSITDSNDNIVYEQYIMPEQTSFILPDSLSGEFTLNIQFQHIQY